MKLGNTLLHLLFLFNLFEFYRFAYGDQFSILTLPFSTRKKIQTTTKNPALTMSQMLRKTTNSLTLFQYNINVLGTFPRKGMYVSRQKQRLLGSNMLEENRNVLLHLDTFLFKNNVITYDACQNLQFQFQQRRAYCLQFLQASGSSEDDNIEGGDRDKGKKRDKRRDNYHNLDLDEDDFFNDGDIGFKLDGFLSKFVALLILPIKVPNIWSVLDDYEYDENIDKSIYIESDEIDNLYSRKRITEIRFIYLFSSIISIYYHNLSFPILFFLYLFLSKPVNAPDIIAFLASSFTATILYPYLNALYGFGEDNEVYNTLLNTGATFAAILLAFAAFQEAISSEGKQLQFWEKDMDFGGQKNEDDQVTRTNKNSIRDIKRFDQWSQWREQDKMKDENKHGRKPTTTKKQNKKNKKRDNEEGTDDLDS